MLRFLLLVSALVLCNHCLAGDVVLQALPTNDEAALMVDSVSFSLDHSQHPAQVKLRLSTEDQNLEIFVDPALISSAALFLSEFDPCVISLSPGCIDREHKDTSEVRFKAHPSLLMQKSVLGLTALVESLLSLDHTNVDYFVLAEKPWHLNVSSFDNTLTHYYVYGMKDGVKTLDARWAEKWEAGLNDQLNSYLKLFNDFLVSRRLVSAGFKERLIGFPVLQFFAFLNETRPYWTGNLATVDQGRAFQQWLDSLKANRTSACHALLKIIRSLN